MRFSESFQHSFSFSHVHTTVISSSVVIIRAHLILYLVVNTLEEPNVYTPRKSHFSSLMECVMVSIKNRNTQPLLKEQ
jgi:hypothetical protein